MGKHERRAYLQAIQKRYRDSDEATKQAIMNEFCEVCGYARKYAKATLVSLMNAVYSQLWCPLQLLPHQRQL